MTISQKLKELEQLKAKADKELEGLAEKITAAEAAQAKAKEEATAAFQKQDVAAYHKAQDAARMAEDTMAMYKAHAHHLESTPLITEAEYKAGLAEIRAELDKENKKAEKEILALMRQVMEISERVAAVMAAGEKALHMLQHDIFRDDACLVGAGGKRVYSATQEETYRNAYYIAGFADDIKRTYLYQEATKK